MKDLKEDSDIVSLREGTTVCLLLRLVGGKGGFGSLLRVQGRDTKATTNFEACRDLSGRRLRHVNTVKRMEEWKKNAPERELEDIALKHISERARNQKRDRNKAMDPDVVAGMQKRTVSNVKDAVQSALKNFKADKSPKAKKARFTYDAETSSDDDDDVSPQSTGGSVKDVDCTAQDRPADLEDRKQKEACQ